MLLPFITGKLKYIALFGVLAAGIMLIAPAAVSAQTRGVVNANKVNVRDAGSVQDSNVLYMVNKGDEAVVTGEQNEYYQVSVNGDENVYIAKEYVKISQADGTVTENVVWIYESPSEDEAVALVNKGETVEITATCKDWYYAAYDGVTGYIRQHVVEVPAYIQLPEQAPPRKAADTASDTSYSYANPDDIIDYAKTLLGIKYVYGSMNPQKGFDCSGFVSYVMKNFDISVSRSSRSMASEGTSVSRDELQKCDLVFFATSGGKTISHVGMYIGNGQFIHASSYGEGVVITNLNDKYYTTRYVKATRVL